MKPEPGFQSGPAGDLVDDSNQMAPCKLVTKPSPPSGGGLRKKFNCLIFE